METKTRRNKAKAWFKTHYKKVLFITVGGAVVVILGKDAIKYRQLMKDAKELGETVLKQSKTLTPVAKIIDEDIFTDLAPTIEEMVLDSGVEKSMIEKNYDLDGLTHKLVTVNIERIMGD